MKIGYKLAAGTILLTAAGVFSVAVSADKAIHQATRDTLKSKAETLTRQFIAHESFSIQKRRAPALLNAILVLLRDPTIVAASVLDPAGRVIADGNMRRIGETKLAIISPLDAGHEFMFQSEGTGSSAFLRIVMKAHAVDPPSAHYQAKHSSMQAVASRPIIGYVTIGLSMGTAQEVVRMVRRHLALLILAVTWLAVLFSLSFAIVITRPIDALMEAIGEIRRGNLGFKARILSTDEIGQAGEAFNRMSEELRRSQDKIIRGEKLAAVGQLASGVGHELRNPLAAIRNAIFYLRDQLKDSPAAAEDPSLLEFLAIADREIIAANNIIRDLLDFARVPVLDIHPADVNAIALEARSILETPAGIAWDMELSQDLPQIPIDAFRIRQVFVNLGGNAIQAMPKGGVLHVATTSTVGPDSETWIHIVFRDTGYGMSKETMSRIFEPLFSTKTTGTGLGLAISLGIVERHGGRITVESVVGRGTTFTVKLPAHPPVGA